MRAPPASIVFLECVKEQVVDTRPDVYLISNRHSGILAAIHQLQYGIGTHASL
jgi:hypothetical protein